MDDYAFSSDDQHVFHHYDDREPTINIKVEKNTKGYGWEVTVIGARSPDEALAYIREAEARLREEYGRIV